MTTLMMMMMQLVQLVGVDQGTSAVTSFRPWWVVFELSRTHQLTTAVTQLLLRMQAHGLHHHHGWMVYSVCSKLQLIKILINFFQQLTENSQLILINLVLKKTEKLQTSTRPTGCYCLL